MPVKELQTFREKFPQYGDMSDGELAVSLAKKYPDSYSDLPQKVGAEINNSLVQDSKPAQKQESALLQNPIASGPLARGAQLASKMRESGSFRDVPSIASKMVSGALGGVPEFVAENPVASAVQSGADFSESMIGRARQKFNMMPQPATNAGREVGDELGMYAGLLPLEMIGGSAIKKIGSTKPVQAVTKLAEDTTIRFTGKATEEQLNRIIDQSIYKGIRPTVSGKGSSYQVESYQKNARNAVKAIVEHKDDLDFGDGIKRLPESLDEFSKSIDQVKRKVFNEYNALAKTTGNENIGVGLLDIADDIEKQADNKALKTLYPDLVGYIKKRADLFRNTRVFTPQEAQDAIEMLNNELKAFYRNPTPQGASHAVADAAIATKLRTKLDDVIEGFTGKEYQSLKNKYGALRTIQDEVTRRAVVDSRKNAKGFFDLGEIFASGDIVKGLLSANPAEIARGGAMKAVVNYIKEINNPNRVVRDMFKIVGKAYKPVFNKSSAVVDDGGRFLTGPSARKMLSGPKVPLKISGSSPKLLEASKDFGEGFERVKPQEAFERIKAFAFKHYSPMTKKIEIPKGEIFGTKAKTLLKGMGINPFTGEIKQGPAKTALEAAAKRSKSL